MRTAARVVLSTAERGQLESWSSPAERSSRRQQRARIVLAAATGAANVRIARDVGVSPETVGRWRSRFALTGLEAIVQDAPRAGAHGRVRPSTVARVLRATFRGPLAGGRAWTTRSLARALRVNHMLVHRIWKAHGLGGAGRARSSSRRPPRVDLAGAFVTPGARAVVFSVDDRPPRRRPPPLPEIFPNPSGAPEFNGPQQASSELVNLAATLEPSTNASGRVSRSVAAALLVFLRGIERRTRRRLRLEVVLDRPVAQLGRAAVRWLAAHGRFRVYATPRLRSWSDAVGAWLARWEPLGLDRSSLGHTAEFARQVPNLPAREGVAAASFVWSAQPGRASPSRSSEPRVLLGHPVLMLDDRAVARPGANAGSPAP